MSQPTHIIDPDGEVLIHLINPNSPFALSEGPSSPLLSYASDLQHYDSEKSESADDSSSLDLPPKKKRKLDGQIDSPSSPAPGVPVFSIKVSAKHMMLASPVFKIMLTGDWKERQTYRETGAVEVTADGWDLEAFLILLRLIHGYNYEVQRKVSLEMLAKVAIIADFYGCKEILHIMGEIWVSSLDEEIPANYCRDLLLWVWISWFFELPALFEESTSRAMMTAEVWIKGWGLPIPKNVLDLMNEGRQGAVGELVRYLSELSEKLLSRRRGCGFECRSMMYGALQIHMRSIGLLSPTLESPYLGLSYRDTVEKLMHFRSPNWAGDGDNGRHRCLDSIFRTLLGDLKFRIQGLEVSAEEVE